MGFKCITPLLHHSTIQSLHFQPGVVFFNGLNFLNALERFELILWLPAAAQSAVELHHGIELPAPNPGQCQLLVEELLVGDQNL